ncbi:PH domain-containing protein [Gracilibacillus massiliensis]|uniref:PH domain-containing protein n=1 Tax=Gracilibacillus massiliensis TaxID=1564956 RepID=UPI00071E0E16|nr:PH domain-containing protein [Gracilibacillus massiliensis]
MNELKLEHKLAADMPKVRMISETIGNIIGFIVLGVLFGADAYFEWPKWIGWILWGVFVFTILGTIWSLIEPKYLYRSWRYQIDENYLQLTYGILKKQWVTVPMTKIQSVSTSQGPILRKYHLRAIKVETMGSSHEIPALEEPIALEVREKIAISARLKEVDE